MFVSSLSGTTQGPLHAAYDSSKAGLQALANALCLEVQGLGVDIGVAHNIYTATQTGREAVEHPLIRGLPGLPKMKPQPVEKTCAGYFGHPFPKSETCCQDYQPSLLHCHHKEIHEQHFENRQASTQ